MGYPDQPILTPLVAWAMNSLAPRSLLVLRIPAALAATVSIVAAALIAREVGGGRRAQAIAAASCAVGAVTLAIGHFMTTTAFDLALTAIGWWLLVRLLRGGDERLWAVLGAVLGVALLNKLVAPVLIGVAIGMLIVLGPREVLRSRWVAVGAGLAVLGALPYLIWQLQHGLPQLDLVHAESKSGDEGGRAGFIPFQLILEGPLLVAVWLPGLIGLLRKPAWHRYRCIGWTCVAIAAVLLLSSGKAYYAAGFYPMLLGFGAVSVEGWLARGGPARMRVLIAAIVLTGAVNAVLALPTLPAHDLAGRVGHVVIRLNSDAGEMVGWPALTHTVASVYDRLPRPPEPTRRSSPPITARRGRLTCSAPRRACPAPTAGTSASASGARRPTPRPR